MGFILRPRLNGVLTALEGGGSGKVRVPVPGCKMGEKRGVGLQVGLQSLVMRILIMPLPHSAG